MFDKKKSSNFAVYNILTHILSLCISLCLSLSLSHIHTPIHYGMTKFYKLARLIPHVYFFVEHSKSFSAFLKNTTLLLTRVSKLYNNILEHKYSYLTQTIYSLPKTFPVPISLLSLLSLWMPGNHHVALCFQPLKIRRFHI